jgi:hypothetical protein
MATPLHSVLSQAMAVAAVVAMELLLAATEVPVVVAEELLGLVVPPHKEMMAVMEQTTGVDALVAAVVVLVR